MIWLRHHLRRDHDQGFTLVEMMIIILMIGILATVAIPTFAGQTDKARDFHARDSITVAQRTAKLIWREQAAYPDMATMLSELRKAQPDLTFRDFNGGDFDGTSKGPSTGPTNVSVSVDDSQMVTLCARSATRRFWCLREDETGSLPSARGQDEPAYRDGLLSLLTAPVAKAASSTMVGKLPSRGDVWMRFGTDERVVRCLELKFRPPLSGCSNITGLPPVVDPPPGGDPSPPVNPPENAPTLAWNTSGSIGGHLTEANRNILAANNSGNVAWTTGGEGVYAQECRHDRKAYPSATWTFGTWESCGTAPFVGANTKAFSSMTKDADHALSVRACNAAGCTVLGTNAQNPMTGPGAGAYRWHVWPDPPTLSISETHGATNDKAISGTLSWTTGGKVTSLQCSVDGGGWSDCSTPRNFAFDGGWTDNSHNIQVIARNEGGNSGVKTLSLSFDDTSWDRDDSYWDPPYGSGYSVQDDWVDGHYHCYSSNMARWNYADDPLNNSQYWPWGTPTSSGAWNWAPCYRTWPYSTPNRPCSPDACFAAHSWYHYGVGGNHYTPRMSWVYTHVYHSRWTRVNQGSWSVGIS